MNVYRELIQIAKLNYLRDKEIEKLTKKLDTYGLYLNSAKFIKDCIEEDGHLYNKDGYRLDNCGLVDNDYYCKQYRGYSEDYYKGTLYYATNEKGTFIEVEFSTY